MNGDVLKGMSHEDCADPNPVQEGLSFSDSPDSTGGEKGMLLKLLMSLLQGGGEASENEGDMSNGNLSSPVGI